MNLRRGTSLVELLIIMSACTVILTLSAELIHRVMIVQSKATAVYNAERSARRLSVTFRKDVHEATQRESAAPDSPDNHLLLRLAMPDNTAVEYRQDKGILERTLIEAGAINAREQFAFPEEIAPEINEQPGGIVMLTITTPIEAPSAEDAHAKSSAFRTPMNLQLSAILGRDRQARAEPPSNGETP